MLASVRNFLSQFGNPDEKILEAMKKIDRKNFMPENLKNFSYEDTAMPIGYGQTISQPSTVARMLSLLELKKGDSVLEVGAGSGWNAALMAWLIQDDHKKNSRHNLKTGGKVLSLEIVDELVEKARKNIEKTGIKNVEIRKEDFRNLKQKFDKIIFTAGISEEQEKIIEDFAREHLNENGILICPFRIGPLIILKKVKGKIKKDYTIEEYVFVELVL